MRLSPEPVSGSVKTIRSSGAAKTISDSAPIVTLKIPEAVPPPVDSNSTRKEVVPSWRAVRVSTGSTRNSQGLP